MSLPRAFLDRPLAHRGLHDARAGRPENTLGAVRAAVAAGYGIEIDVQPSAEGRAMVFHDDALERLTGVSGRTRAASTARLRALKVLGSDEGIPTLTEVLAEVAGRAPLLIEIKDQDGAMGPEVGALEAAVAADLAGYAGPVAVMSFNPHSVAAFAAAAPDVPRGLTTESYPDRLGATLPAARRAELRAIGDLDRVGATFISHEAADLNSPRVAEIKARGLPVLCWTIRSQAQERRARAIADNITFEGYLPQRPAA